MKPDIRLVAFDLDNTLLNSRKEISERNRRALTRCVEEGIEIVPCTGRIWKGIPDCVRNFPGINYLIAINGAMIEDLSDHSIIYEKCLPYETTIELMEGIKDQDVMYDCYIEGQGYGESRFLDQLEHYHVPDSLRPMFDATRVAVPDVIGLVAELKKPVQKINFNFHDYGLRDRVKAELSLRADLEVTASFKNNVEINEPGASKGQAIFILADYLGIDPSQTMGFGDGDNDISMMKSAGIGVAMANAIDEVKGAADLITLTNDEDGVGAALENILFDGTDLSWN